MISACLYNSCAGGRQFAGFRRNMNSTLPPPFGNRALLAVFCVSCFPGDVHVHHCLHSCLYPHFLPIPPETGPASKKPLIQAACLTLERASSSELFVARHIVTLLGCLFSCGRGSQWQTIPLTCVNTDLNVCQVKYPDCPELYA